MNKDKQRDNLFGTLLLEAGLITEQQLEEALKYQKEWGARLGANLIRLGYLPERKLMNFLTNYFGIPDMDLTTEQISKEIIDLVPREIAEKFQAVPVELKFDNRGERLLVLAMKNPKDREAIEAVSSITGYPIEPVLASDFAIECTIRHHYHGKRFLTNDEKSQKLEKKHEESLAILDRVHKEIISAKEEVSKALDEVKTISVSFEAKVEDEDRVSKILNPIREDLANWKREFEAVQFKKLDNLIQSYNLVEMRVKSYEAKWEVLREELGGLSKYIKKLEEDISKKIDTLSAELVNIREVLSSFITKDNTDISKYSIKSSIKSLEDSVKRHKRITFSLISVVFVLLLVLLLLGLLIFNSRGEFTKIGTILKSETVPPKEASKEVEVIDEFTKETKKVSEEETVQEKTEETRGTQPTKTKEQKEKIQHSPSQKKPLTATGSGANVREGPGINYPVLSEEKKRVSEEEIAQEEIQESHETQLTKTEEQKEKIQHLPSQKKLLTVTASLANIREGPGINYPVISVAKEGKVFERLDDVRGGKWIKIKTQDGTEGWISKKVVSSQRKENLKFPLPIKSRSSIHKYGASILAPS